MGVQPITLPNFPPEGPWDAYVSIIIWTPLILRILFLLVPFRNAIRKLAPHAGWALKQVRDLPVRGFGLLAANEFLAILFPPLLSYWLECYLTQLVGKNGMKFLI